MKKLDTQGRAVAAAIAGILAATMLTTACGGGAEAETKAADETEANGCNSANGCNGQAASTAAADHADANGCNGSNGCNGESEAAE
jgi:hypothetical protein